MGGPRSSLRDFAEARAKQSDLAKQMHLRAVLMERAEGPAGEAYTDKFFRLVEAHDVQTFLVLWPVHAQMNALDVEFGFLLRGLREARLLPDAVQLLVERRPGQLRETGGETVLAEDEPGNRTFYYGDFARYGCPIRRWGSPRALFRQTGAALRAHAERFEEAPGR